MECLNSLLNMYIPLNHRQLNKRHFHLQIDKHVNRTKAEIKTIKQTKYTSIASFEAQ